MAARRLSPSPGGAQAGRTRSVAISGARVSARSRRSQGEVIDMQRQRMLVAMAQVCRELGAGRVTISAVVCRAGVSRRTFYELFEDRQQCLVAALEEGLRRAAAYVVPAYRAQSSWRGAVRAGIEGLLAFIDEDRIFGALLVVESLAGGDEMLRRRASVLEGLADAVDRGRSLARSPRSVSRANAEGAVGAVLSILHTRLLADPEAPVMTLAGDLTALVVGCYLGPAATAREARRPAQRAQGGIRVPAGDPIAGLGMRLTYRTLRVLRTLAEQDGRQPGLSNRQVSQAAGIADQGQASKLLKRLAKEGLIVNGRRRRGSSEANTWTLTGKGAQIESACRGQI